MPESPTLKHSKIFKIFRTLIFSSQSVALFTKKTLSLFSIVGENL